MSQERVGCEITDISHNHPKVPMTAWAAGQVLPELRPMLTTRFDESELRILCLELGEDYENLPPGGKAGKARELVRYLDRRNHISELVETGKRLRPDISWPEVASDE